MQFEQLCRDEVPGTPVGNSEQLDQSYTSLIEAVSRKDGQLLRVVCGLSENRSSAEYWQAPGPPKTVQNADRRAPERQLPQCPLPASSSYSAVGFRSGLRVYTSKLGFALGKAIEHSFMYGNDRIEARSSISMGEEVTLALIALILILLETRSFLLHDFAWKLYRSVCP